MSTFAGMRVELWVQFFYQIITFMATIVCATWALAMKINSLAAIAAKSQAILAERVAMVESDIRSIKAMVDSERANTLRFSDQVAQQAIALATLTSTIARLQQTLDR